MLKVGDKVRVIDNGDFGVVLAVDNDSVPYLVELKRDDTHNDYEWFADYSLELVPPTPKEMLKVGMVVENNNGTLFMVYKNKSDNLLFIEENGNFSKLGNYNDDLMSNFSGKYDIAKIYSLCTRNCDLNEISTKDRILVWEREPEYFSGKVVCIESDDLFFTKGKIYKVKNGLINDDFSDNNYLDEAVKNIDELNSKTITVKFIELVED